jgi:hypothetical protein
VCATKGVFIMRLLTIGIIGLVCVGMTRLALANPALLPKHLGYSLGGEVTYDRGQRNVTPAQSLLNAAESENANIVQKLEDHNNAKLLRQEGAGLLPIVQGPNTKIISPVTEATQIPKRSLAVRVRRGAFTKCPLIQVCQESCESLMSCG